jgi:hypothetical protein
MVKVTEMLGDVMDTASLQLLADIQAILHPNFPRDLRQEAIAEAHAGMTQQDYLSVWPHLSSSERSMWKYYLTGVV